MKRKNRKYLWKDEKISKGEIKEEYGSIKIIIFKIKNDFIYIYLFKKT